MIRGTRDHFFKKRFSKLDFLKAVSVIIVFNSAPPTQFFGNFIPSPSKKELGPGGGKRTMCIYLKF